MPDFRVKINIKNDLEPKSSVLYYPIDLSQEFIDSLLAESILKQMIDHLSYECYMGKFLNNISLCIFLFND